MSTDNLPAIKVKIPGPLRTPGLGADQIQLRAGSVRQALQTLAERDPDFAHLVLMSNGSLRRTVFISVGNQDVRLREGLDTRLQENDEVVLVAAISGG
jgi:molybdopterin converting factor small subunit